MKKVVSILLVLAMMLSLAACSGESTETTNGGNGGESAAPAGENTRDDLIFSISSDTTSLDPAEVKDTISYLVLFQMFDTLVREEPDGTIAPALAESWEWNAEATELTMLIRQGVKFHDGTDMTVDDVVYSMNRAIASSYTSAVSSEFDRMEKVDDTHVKLVLKEPYVATLSCLCSANLGIVPQTAGEPGGGFSKNPVGTGPYKFVSWSEGEKIEMEANEDYWRGAPAIKKLTIKIHTDRNTAAIALEKGEVDVLYYPDTADRMNLMNLENVTWLEGEATTLFYLAFNCRDGVFSDVRLRQAVCYALNRDDIIALGADGAGIATANTIPVCTEYYKDFEGYQQNIEKAKELMKEAGYEGGLTITMKTSQSSIYSKPTQVIQSQLAEIGIEVNIELMERAAYLEETQTACNYEATFYVITNNITDPDYIMTRRFHSKMEGGGNNFTLFKDENLDKLIDQARGESDKAKRQELYDQINEILYENAVIDPMYEGMTRIAFNSNLQGVYTSGTERHYVSEYSWK